MNYNEMEARKFIFENITPENQFEDHTKEPRKLLIQKGACYSPKYYSGYCFYIRSSESLTFGHSYNVDLSTNTVDNLKSLSYICKLKTTKMTKAEIIEQLEKYIEFLN